MTSQGCPSHRAPIFCFISYQERGLLLLRVRTELKQTLMAYQVFLSYQEFLDNQPITLAILALYSQPPQQQPLPPPSPSITNDTMFRNYSTQVSPGVVARWKRLHRFFDINTPIDKHGSSQYRFFIWICF